MCVCVCVYESISQTIVTLCIRLKKESVDEHRDESVDEGAVSQAIVRTKGRGRLSPQALVNSFQLCFLKTMSEEYDQEPEFY